MQKTTGILISLIFFLQVLLLFLLFVEDRIALPIWLQVAGRLHPAALHLPIGLAVFFVILVLVQKEFKKKAFRKIALVLLLLTSLTASVTALFGFFLSRQGDYGLDALAQHKIAGTLFSILCFILVLGFTGFKPHRTAFYFVGLVTLGVMFFTGHTGGILTHGENYLLAPLSNASDDLVFDKNVSVFQMAVYPVLKNKCMSCHNESKAKGKFVMTSIEKFKIGGKRGKEWQEGKPGESRIIKYIHLPLEDDDHMPPDGKPQLTAKEIALLENWIKSGADFERRFTDLGENDSLRIITTGIFAAKIKPTEEKKYTFSPAPEEVIKKLNTPFRSVFQLYQNCPALQVDFFIKESFHPKDLEDLKEVQDQVVVLNLSKMPVTDGDLALVGNFKNLEKLNLNFSQVSGAGLTSLQPLKNLNSLSLAGTGITAGSLKPVLGLPALKELFIWNTKITDTEMSALIAKFPKMLIMSSQFKDDKILRLGKPLLVNEGVVKKGEMITLKHSMPGVTIRYTLDGTKPDSVISSTYDSPMKLSGTSKIKAIACKSGWYCSDVFEMTCFLEGQKPERCELLSATDSYYRGEGAKSLTDGEKGFIEVLNAPPWLGYRDRQFVAGFDFGKETKVNSIVISYAKSLGGSFFPPKEVEVWGGKNVNQLKLIKTMKIEQPKLEQPQQVEALIIPIVNAEYSFYKLVAKPVDKLPAWHSAKGKKGWLLIDEVIFN